MQWPPKRWQLSVGWTLTARDGTYCGYVGMADGGESQEDCWNKAIAWLRRSRVRHREFLIYTWKIEVSFF